MKTRVFYRRGPGYSVWRQLFVAIVHIANGTLNIVIAPFGYTANIDVRVLAWLIKRDFAKRKAANGDE